MSKAVSSLVIYLASLTGAALTGSRGLAAETSSAVSPSRENAAAPSGRSPSTARFLRTIGSGEALSVVSPHLSYFGGPVVHTGTTYAIYWLPPGTSVSPGYQSTINQYFMDIGGTAFYNVLTQYPDSCCPTQNVSTFGGSWVDTRPYPHAGTEADPLLTEDIDTEVLEAIGANPDWNAPGPETLYFVFTGQNIFSCFDSSHTGCSYQYYCAYHTYFLSGATPILYAYIPYLSPSITFCSGGGVPPGDADAHVTINALAHEHFEIVNDPEPDTSTGWLDPATDLEIADICAFNFGALNPDNTNVVLNGHGYKIQSMWSNVDNACVLSFNPTLITALGVQNNSPNQQGTPTHLVVSITGGGPGVSYQYDFGDGSTAGPTSARSVFHPYPSGGSYAATVTATGLLNERSATTSVWIVTNQGFGVSAAPPSRTVRAGASASYAVSTTDINGFPADISLFVLNLPAGAAASCSPSRVPPGGGATCTVMSGTAAQGTYSLTIAASSGTISRNTSVSLSIVPCANDVECDDGAFCSGVETCASGHCVAGSSPSCDDGNGCTSDTCNPISGCAHTSVPPPAEVNDTVRLARTPVDATLDWNDGAGPFNVYRGVNSATASWSYNHECFAPGVPGATASDPSDPPTRAFFYYLVTRVSSCGESIPGRDSSLATIPNALPCP